MDDRFKTDTYHFIARQWRQGRPIPLTNGHGLWILATYSEIFTEGKEPKRTRSLSVRKATAEAMEPHDTEE